MSASDTSFQFLMIWESLKLSFTFGRMFCWMQNSCLTLFKDFKYVNPVLSGSHGFLKQRSISLKISYTWYHFSFAICTVLKLFLYIIFYWRIIALQNFAVFCHTSTWISHRYTYISSLLNLRPTPLGWYRVPVWVSWAIQQISIGHLFYI